MQKFDGKAVENFLDTLKTLLPYQTPIVPTTEQILSTQLVKSVRKALPRSNLLYLKWEDDKYDQFERLLATDRALNLTTRNRYFTERGLTTYEHNFVEVLIEQKRHGS
jgi:hypothetical protein